MKRILLGLTLTVLVGLFGWWAWPKKGALDERYVTMALERGAITQTVAANGTLNPVKLVNVGSQVSGIVKKLYVDFNDRVSAGQLLLELDPSLNEAQLRQSEANVASAHASLELAQANEARTRDLFAKEYVTRQELDTAVQALKAAQAQVALTEAQATRDRTNLNYTVIRSPVSGVVVSRLVDVGQTVAASFQAPTLFTIAQDLTHMQIDSSYAEADVGNIRMGQEATFRVDAFPNRIFHGQVRQVRLNPTTLQNVVTYDVVVSVENPEQLLMPGMTAYVNIQVAQRKDALLLPNAALRFRPADAGKAQDKPRGNDPKGERSKDGAMGTVYVLENGQLKPVRVAIGITDNRMTEVLGGELKEGVKVVVADQKPPSKDAGPRGMRLF